MDDFDDYEPDEPDPYNDYGDLAQYDHLFASDSSAVQLAALIGSIWFWIFVAIGVGIWLWSRHQTETATRTTGAAEVVRLQEVVRVLRMQVENCGDAQQRVVYRHLLHETNQKLYAARGQASTGRGDPTVDRQRGPDNAETASEGDDGGE